MRCCSDFRGRQAALIDFLARDCQGHRLHRVGNEAASAAELKACRIFINFSLTNLAVLDLASQIVPDAFKVGLIERTGLPSSQHVSFGVSNREREWHAGECDWMVVGESLRVWFLGHVSLHLFDPMRIASQSLTLRSNK